VGGAHPTFRGKYCELALLVGWALPTNYFCDTLGAWEREKPNPPLSVTPTHPCAGAADRRGFGFTFMYAFSPTPIGEKDVGKGQEQSTNRYV